MEKFRQYVKLRDLSEVDLPAGWGIVRPSGEHERGDKPSIKYSPRKILSSLSEEEWKGIYERFIKGPRSQGDRPDTTGFRNHTYRMLLRHGLEDMADYVLHTEREGGAPARLIRSIYTSLSKNPHIDPEGASAAEAQKQARKEKRQESKLVRKYKQEYTPESLDERIKQVQMLERSTGMSYIEWIALYIKEKHLGKYVGEDIGSFYEIMKGLKEGRYDELLFDDSPNGILNMLERAELNCKGGPDAPRHYKDPTKYAYKRGAKGELITVPKPTYRVSCGLSPFEIKTILETIKNIDLNRYNPKIPEEQRKLMKTYIRPGQLTPSVVNKLMSEHGE